MNKKVILLAGLVALFTSCNQTKKETLIAVVAENDYVAVEINSEPNEGYTLMKNNCYACHNPNTASHDDILAPPFKGVKMHYMRKYDTKKEFVDAMVNWVQNPTEDKALMRGAVSKFKVMPKLPLPTEDLEKIATYIYENDVDEPKWIESHMKEKQGNKKGKGMMKKNGKGSHTKDEKTCGNDC